MMDDPNHRPAQQQQPSPASQHQQHQPHQQQQQQHQGHQGQQQQQQQDQDNQQPPQPGADLIEATISALLLPSAAKPQDYHEILPKFSSQLKTDFENRNLWLRFGLTIELSRDSPQSALQAFHECMRIDQDDPLPAMLAAKLLLDQLDDPEQALKVASEAISRCQKQLLQNPVNISNGIDSLDNCSIEMICSSVSSLSTSNHSSSLSTIVQAPTSAEVAADSGHPSKTSSNNSDQHIKRKNLQEQQAATEQISKTTTSYKNIAPILSRCYVLASATHAYLYEREPISIRKLFKEANLKASLELLDAAQETNPQDYLVYFHKALHQAKQRTYPKAIDNLRRAIQINPHHIPSIQLLILSLSALKLYEDALTLCESILREHDDDLMLLYIKCNLEQCLVETKGYKVALNTAQHMLKCIKQSSSRNSRVYGHTKNYSSTTTISIAAQSQYQSQQQQQNQQPSNTLVSSNNSNSITAAGPASLTPTAAGSMSLIAQTSATNNLANMPATLLNPAGDMKQMSNLFPDETVSDPADGANLLAGGELSIWILVAEIFVKIGSVEDAEMCVEEGSAHTNGTLSYPIMYIRGLVAKARNQLAEAKTFFQSCLALCPRHARALQQIAHVHYLLGNYSTAEKFLRDSLDLEADCHKTWYYLSLVYIELNQHDRASECVKKSTALEATSPPVPFSAISRLTLQ